MKPKLIGSLALMLALAAAAFTLMVALMEARIGRPIGPVPGRAAAEIREPSEVLTQGIEQSLTTARNAFDQHRQSEISRALDAAMRASEVAKDALQGTRAGVPFDGVHHTIMQARIALQNDNPDQAARLVEAALTALPREQLNGASAPADLAQYAGATVMNAEGVRVGKVKRVETGALTLSLGGHYDVMGFISWGGQVVKVDPEQVLFGRKKTAGTTFVSLPSAATSPDRLAATLASAFR